MSEFHALAQHLGNLANTVGEALGVATQKAVQDTIAQSRSLAPVDTGHLRASIHGHTESTAVQASGEVTASAEYAVYVENGTSRMAPQPFMRPAQEAVTPGWLAAIAQLGGSAR